MSVSLFCVIDTGSTGSAQKFMCAIPPTPIPAVSPQPRGPRRMACSPPSGPNPRGLQNNAQRGPCAPRGHLGIACLPLAFKLTLTPRLAMPPPSSQTFSVQVFTVGATMCFVVLSNRHLFNIASLPFAPTLVTSIKQQNFTCSTLFLRLYWNIIWQRGRDPLL